LAHLSSQDSTVFHAPGPGVRALDSRGPGGKEAHLVITIRLFQTGVPAQPSQLDAAE
jgi:hypothetical protein